jgi:hypothetical protein
VRNVEHRLYNFQFGEMWPKRQLLSSSLHLFWAGLYYQSVVRRVLQLGSLACLTALSLFYPLIESLDGWDSPLPASDLEINIIGMLTFLGVAFLLAQLLASLSAPDLMSVVRQLFSRQSRAVQEHDGIFHPQVTASPPLPLRI